MRKVPALRPGDTIGFIAPSSPTPRKQLERSIEITESLGFNVVVGESCYASWGYLAGPDDLRAGDVNRMFGDPSVKGIFCVRGGDGATRLPERIDMPLLRNNPKVFLGYSDVTVLHLMILKEAGFCTFHGPMPSTEFVKETFEGYVKDSFLRALMDTEPLGEILPYEGAPPMRGLVPGVAEGEIVGGCLALICALLGTPWEIDTRGKILVFEDVNEEPYRIDRMLCSLRMAGKLRDAAAIVVGQIEKAEAKDPEKSLTLEEVWQSHLANLEKPVLLGGCFGHGVKKATLPLGARARVDASKEIFSLLESGVY
ncbi:MAG TPA: LD-carboxypeptidase [Synergistaceae bacterium]|nr:LD-carboxypeptidase [Synergistaceae bacterium]